MDINIKFDHSSYLSLPELQTLGIRKMIMLEEVFLDIDAAPVEITMAEDNFPVFFIVGFSQSMLPLLYIFEIPDISSDLVIVSKYARIATKQELKKFFCR